MAEQADGDVEEWAFPEDADHNGGQYDGAQEWRGEFG
jgi:hypothetical protein